MRGAGVVKIPCRHASFFVKGDLCVGQITFDDICNFTSCWRRACAHVSVVFNLVGKGDLTIELGDVGYADDVAWSRGRPISKAWFSERGKLNHPPRESGVAGTDDRC